MKAMKVVGGVVIVGALMFAAGQMAGAARQPEKAPKDKAAQPTKELKEKLDQEMAAMMALSQPGEEHKLLAKAVGTWDVTAKFMMPGPDGKPGEQTSKGEAKFSSELDGRFIRQDFKGEMMGGPFAGFGYEGYDKIEKRFFGTWADTMGTSMMYMTGTYDKATKTMTMTGSFKMPGEKGIEEYKARYVTVHTDDDHFTMSMYHAGADGKEMKEGDISYTRRK